MRKPSIWVLYWDYELEQGGLASRGGRPAGWGQREYDETARLLDLLDQYQIKSVFATLGIIAGGEALPFHAPDQVREIARRGHEIGCHTWGHEWIPSLTRDAFRENLSRCKTALEQVSGVAVESFAPPWNVPSRYLRKGSIGVYEMRRSQQVRLDIPAMCAVLHEVGFRTARIHYETPLSYLKRRITGEPIWQPAAPLWVGQTFCLRINARGGFGPATLRVVEAAAEQGGVVVSYAHPGSIITPDNPQHVDVMLPFFERVAHLRDTGRLQIMTAREVYDAWQ